MTTRRLAMSRTGRWLLVADGELCELVDLMGAMPIRVVEVSPQAIVELVGRELWVVDGGALVRYAPSDLRPLSVPTPLPGPITAIVPTGGAALSEAVLVGRPTVRVGQRGSGLVFEVVTDLRPDERLLAGQGARFYLGAN